MTLLLCSAQHCLPLHPYTLAHPPLAPFLCAQHSSAIPNTHVHLWLRLPACLIQVVMRVGRHVGPDGVARVAGLCLALVVLGQGIPFIHAGDDLLRSKSLDRDSYNSGVWRRRGGWLHAGRKEGRVGT